MAITQERMQAIITAARDFYDSFVEASRFIREHGAMEPRQPELDSVAVLVEAETHYRKMAAKNYWNREHMRRKRAKAGGQGPISAVYRAQAELGGEAWGEGGAKAEPAPARDTLPVLQPYQEPYPDNPKPSNAPFQSHPNRAPNYAWRDPDWNCPRPPSQRKVQWTPDPNGDPNRMEYLGGDRVVTVTPQPEWHNGDALFTAPEGSGDTLPVCQPDPSEALIDTTLPLPGWEPLPAPAAYVPPPQAEWTPDADPSVSTADEATILAGLLAGTMTLTGAEAHAYWEPRLAAARQAKAQAAAQAQADAAADLAAAQAVEAERLAKGLPKGVVGRGAGKRAPGGT